MLCSIILPVYNVEKYLSECLSSLCSLPSDAFEIIAINDGSTDNSKNILESYRVLLPSMKIIDQKNGGLSKARNVGLENAKGKYIAFIDSDDYINSDKFVEIINEAEYTLADIVIGNFEYVQENNKVELPRIGQPNFPTNKYLKGRDFYKKHYMSLGSMVWRNVYRYDFLKNNNLFFLEGVLFEDVEFIPRAFFAANLVYYSSISFYYYRLRNNSITSTVGSMRKVQDTIKVWSSLRDHSKNIIDGDIRSIMHECGFHSFLLQFSLLKREDAMRITLNPVRSILKSGKLRSLKYKIIKLFILICSNSSIYYLLKLKK